MKPFLQKIAKTIALLFVLCNLQPVFAQAPQKMSYQAVIRDADNTLVTNTLVGIRISILQTTSTGTAVFVETHTPTTNANGLATLEIGGGNPVSGNFSSINWANGPYFIKTETDPTGGTNYTISGTSQLLSTPYALFAERSGNTSSMPSGNNIGDILVWNGSQWAPSNFKFYYADQDGDSYGNHYSQVYSPSQPTGYVLNDCDPDDTHISNGIGSTVWYIDSDGDGFPNTSLPSISACTQPAGYISFNQQNQGFSDCDDTKANVHPGASEICDGIDNDCDGQIDEKITAYLDNDHDTFGDDTNTIQTCFPIQAGYTNRGGDCNDNEFFVNPGIPGEICDGLDNNCDGQIDESPNYVFADNDNDGFGADYQFIQWNCADPLPFGYAKKNGDCDDFDPQIHPGAVEICDGRDNDCNGLVDDNPTVITTFYADLDQDGYGDTNNTTTAAGCTPPTGYVINNGDCDDSNPNINPNALESCNGIDDNCNGQIDEGITIDGNVYYIDMDNDGIGAGINGTIMMCSLPPNSGYSEFDGDCDDGDPTIYPGAPEICDGKDNDCNGFTDEGIPTTTWYFDADSDGFGNPATAMEACSQQNGYVDNSLDCDDYDPNVNPGALEICDGIDNDCNGMVDDNAIDAQIWYQDADSDGFGNPSQTTTACSAPNGYVANSTDCDDADASINPATIEICDGKDNNCDGTIDENPIDGSIWYIDADSDGFGNPEINFSVTACTQPNGYVANNTDCNDQNPSINPGMMEICDNLDNDCNGLIDDNSIDGQIWYQDADGDGYGNPSITVSGCSAPAGYVANNTDCDDTRAGVHPNAIEICGNGIDENCNGQVDEAGCQ